MDDDAGNVAMPPATGAGNTGTGSGTSSMDVDAGSSGMQLQDSGGSKACPAPASLAGGTYNNNNVVSHAASRPVPPSRLANLQSLRGFPSPTSEQLRVAPTHVVTSPTTSFRDRGYMLALIFRSIELLDDTNNNHTLIIRM